MADPVPAHFESDIDSYYIDCYYLLKVCEMVVIFVLTTEICGYAEIKLFWGPLYLCIDYIFLKKYLLPVY